MFLKQNERFPKIRSRRLKPLHRLNIQTLEHLGLLLGSSPEELRKYAASPRKYFLEGVFHDKKGKARPKAEPIGRLKVILKALNSLLQRLDLPITIHGGREGCSNLTNAEPHRRQDVVLTFDIKNFFPNISPQRVFDMFHRRCGCKPEIAALLAKLTTLNHQLAQGSPPSTIIAALVADRMLRRIEHLVRLRGGTVTLYVDDITVSGPKGLVAIKDRIVEIIMQERFESHPEKRKVKGQNEEQLVTGVRVNEQLDVSKERFRSFRRTVAKFENMVLLRGKLPPLELGELLGQIGYLSRLNKGAAKHYHKRVRRLEEYLWESQNLANCNLPRAS